MKQSAFAATNTANTLVKPSTANPLSGLFFAASPLPPQSRGGHPLSGETTPRPSFFPDGYFAGKRIRVLKGKWRGAKFTGYQSANDWITVIPPHNPRYRHLRNGYIILDPKNVQVIPQKLSRSALKKTITREFRRGRSGI